MLGLVNVRAHGYDGGDSEGVGFRGANRGGMHDRNLRVSQEVRAPSQPIQHPGEEDEYLKTMLVLNRIEGTKETES